MRDRDGLPRGKRSELRRAADLSCGGIRSERSFARVAHPYLAPNPGVRFLDRSAGSMVVGSNVLEMMEHMFCAVGRPNGQEVVVGIQQSAAATHSDQSGVALRREDHEVRRYRCAKAAGTRVRYPIPLRAGAR